MGPVRGCIQKKLIRKPPNPSGESYEILKYGENPLKTEFWLPKPYSPKGENTRRTRGDEPAAGLLQCTYATHIPKSDISCYCRSREISSKSCY